MADPRIPKNAPRLRNAPIDGNSRVALALLRQAYTYAQDAGADLWDFALEIEKLYLAGLTINDLRWLVAKGFVEHGQETSVYGEPHRSFYRSDGFFFKHRTCVVLTDNGTGFASQFLQEYVAAPPSTQPFESACRSGDATERLRNQDAADEPNGATDAYFKPRWNSTRRELTLNGTVVKRYRVPAQNQELILDAFEEEGWPQHIDDPLPPTGDTDPSTRLHDAINKLNGHHTNRLLHFRGNGMGTGIFWELRRPTMLSSPGNLSKS
jgi:hypothetical protein